jgi:HK97 family phage major capsid protein
MDDLTEVKNLIAESGKAWEGYKATMDELAEQTKKLGAADALTEQKLARIDEALSKAVEAKDAALARVDAMEKKFNRPGMGHNGGPDLAAEVKAFNAAAAAHAAASSRQMPAAVDEEGYRAYKTGFRAFMSAGKDGLEIDERKAMAVGSDPDGGYLVPADMSGRMITRVFETSPIRQIANVQLIGTDALEGIADTDENSSGGAVAERGARTETDTAQLKKWRIEVHEQYAAPRATQKLLDDANVDAEGWLARKTADIMARTENTWFVTGNGINKPKGFTAYTTAATADASRTWGTLEHIMSGASADFAASNPADKLFDLIGAFKDTFLANARWVTRREVITKIRKFKDTAGGTYLWQPGLQAGQPQQILSFPVTIAQDMPALGADSLSLAFGDFSEGYQIVDRQGIRVLRDPYSAKPYVEFYTTKRVGGGVVNFEAIKFLKFNT